MSKTIYTQRLSWVQDVGDCNPNDEAFSIEAWQTVVDDTTRCRVKVVKVDRLAKYRCRVHVKTSKPGLVDCNQGFSDNCWGRLNYKKMKVGTLLKKLAPKVEWEQIEACI